MRALLVAAAVLLALAAPAWAHDIGVTRVDIEETEPGRYVVTAQVPTSVAHRFAAPRFPDGFELAGEPGSGVGAGGFLRFEYERPGRPLLAEEVIEIDWPRDGVMAVMRWSEGPTVSRIFQRRAGAIEVPLADLSAGSGSFLATARRYTVLGVEHILSGVDHLVFVIGLLFLVRGRWVLVKTITAFTVAHSITLGAATLGLVTPSEPFVNAMIAMSILFLGPEMVRAVRGRSSLTIRYPWVVAFAFGLLHGLGFASGLSALGMPRPEIPLALLSFNIGVEIGQLGFVSALLAVAASTRVLEFRWTARQALIPAYLVGTLGVYWTISRAAALFGANAG